MLPKQKIEALLALLTKGIYEKEEPLRLSLLAAIAGESIFLLGSPGVAKSLIARKLKFAFSSGKSFEYLMSRFSTPDEIFGPISIKKLKDQDQYERLTDKYLPGANIVFLDEIWKAGPAIQNALLTVMNEKIYRNGEQDIKIEMKGLIAASNELPMQGEGLEALWDRFLLRCVVQEIRQSNNFISMITDTTDVYEDNVPNELKITDEELENWQTEINTVTLPQEVLTTIQVVRYQLEELTKNNISFFDISDRRWKKIVRLLRTAAFLNNRKEVNLMDCFLMVHCLWNKPEQIEIVQEVVAETIKKHGYSVAMHLNELKKEIAEIEQDINAEIKVNHVVLQDQLLTFEHEYYELVNMEQYFDGKRIKCNDYDKLKNGEETTINIYNDAHQLVHRLKSQRSSEPNTIIIYFNSKEYTFQLATQKVEKSEIIYRKPHNMLITYWNDRLAQLTHYIQQQQESLATKREEKQQSIISHLFVEKELSDLVLFNLQRTKDLLDQNLLELNKIKFSYQSLVF